MKDSAPEKIPAHSREVGRGEAVAERAAEEEEDTHTHTHHTHTHTHTHTPPVFLLLLMSQLLIGWSKEAAFDNMSTRHGEV